MKKKGQSLSDIIENYLKVVVTEKTDPETENAPLTKTLKGSFKAPSNYDYKKQLINRLSEKCINQNGQSID